MSLILEQDTKEDDIRKNDARIARFQSLHPGEYVAVDETDRVLAHSPSLDKVDAQIRRARGKVRSCVSIVSPR